MTGEGRYAPFAYPFLLVHNNYAPECINAFHIVYARLSPLWFCLSIARKLCMNLFTSARQGILRTKFVVGMVVLVTVGMVGGGNAFSHLQTTGHTRVANCPSHTNPCVTPQSTSTIHIATSSIPGKTGYPRSRPKRVIIVHPVVPAPISAVRVYPTPVPTKGPVVTTPAPTTTPIPTGQSSVATMIEQVFGPYAPGALQVARCESGLNPGAYNPTSIGGSHASGVFQILYPSTWVTTSEAGSSPFNAQANIQAAHQIFVRDGYNWHEWSCAA